VVIPEDFNPFELPSASARNSADPLASMAGPQAAASHSLTQEEASIDAMFTSGAGASVDDLLAGTGRSQDPLGGDARAPASPLSQPDNSDPLAWFSDAPASPNGVAMPMRDDLAEVAGAYEPPRPLDPLAAFTASAPAHAAPPASRLAPAIGADFLADPSAATAVPAPRPAPEPQMMRAQVSPQRLVEPPPVPSLDQSPVQPAVGSPLHALGQPLEQPSAQPQAPSPSTPQPPVTAPAVAPQPAVLGAEHADALTRAFLDGAGLPASALPQGLTPETMAMVGRLLRCATTGAIDMLAIRANIKREVQASVTIISTEANNPLKFLHDADAVLQLFLGKKMRGFMSPEEALQDAFNDLGAHELGVIAGTRAALHEVLAKFDPALLADRLVQGSLLEKALPAMRKTRLWDLYVERFAQIRLEAEDDFQSIFGRAFVAAYEAETARMKARPGGAR
jgi:FHA domain-containing protein